MMATETSPIELANERSSILAVCRMVGVEVPDFDFGNAKLYCPFGHLYHVDGGRTKAFRAYPVTNSAYCFAGCGWFSPTKLLAADRGLPEEEAADILLDLSGYVPPDIDSRWNAAVQTTVAIDTDSLSEALKIACERMDPSWETRQFEETVSTRFRQCLELLPRVQSENDATKWLAITKQIMSKVLGAQRG